MVWWLCGAALAGKWDGVPADVTVSRVVPAPREAVHALLADWHGFEAVMPATCASEWEIPANSGGVGARSRARYTIGPMKRRLVGLYTKNTPGLVLETELEGKKGWFLQVTYADAEGGTLVTWNTPLTPTTKWPVAGLFHKKVKPAWEQCYREALDAVAAKVSAAG